MHAIPRDVFTTNVEGGAADDKATVMRRKQALESVSFDNGGKGRLGTSSLTRYFAGYNAPVGDTQYGRPRNLPDTPGSDDPRRRRRAQLVGGARSDQLGGVPQRHHGAARGGVGTFHHVILQATHQSMTASTVPCNPSDTRE
jgi:hypothetical protein